MPSYWTERALESNVVDRFRALEQVLSDRFPEARREAEALGKGIANPSTADAHAVWEKIWDKPLFAFTKVKYGAEKIRRLSPYMENAWRNWGTDGDAFYIAKVGKGSGTIAFEAVTLP